MSFDIWAARLPRIEVYGTGGSLSVPDPNNFAGPVELYSAAAADDGLGRRRRAPPATSTPAAATGWPTSRSRIAEGRPHRAGDELALHVLDIMESVQQAADTHASVELTTTCERPAAVAGTVDLTEG